MVDIKTANEVEVRVGPDRQVWINIDGQCALRIGKVTGPISIDNPRSPTIKGVLVTNPKPDEGEPTTDGEDRFLGGYEPRK